MKKLILGAGLAGLACLLGSMSSPLALADNTYQDELKEISNTTAYIKATKIIKASEKDGLAAMIELTEIPAPPFKEEKRAARLFEMLGQAGADSIFIDDVGNVIAKRQGKIGKKVVVLSAHIDTVFSEETDVSVKIVGDKYYAPGISDNTRGLVNMIMVLQAMEQANIQADADILFIGTVGEEGLGDLRGVKHLFRDNGPQIDSFIAIDGGTANRLIFGGVGSVRYKVTFKGPGGHSWGRFGDANPHHALGRVINHFVSSAPSVTSNGPKTSYNIGRIGGGTSVNSIPFESWMEVDMRSQNKDKLNAIEKVFKAAVTKALKEENDAKLTGGGITVDLRKVGFRPVAIAKSSDPIVQRAMAAMRVVGLTSELAQSSTDANIPISKNIPAVTLSHGGKSGGAHTLHEWWQDNDTAKSVELALLLLLAEAGLSK